MGRSLLDRFGKKTPPSSEIDSKSSKTKQVALVQPTESPDALSDKDWYSIHRLWRSSLFNEYYLKYELKQKKGREMLEYDSGFQLFLQQFRELCQNRQNEAFKSWKESDTIESWIMPVMQALGWWDPANDPCVREATLSAADGRSFFLDRLFVQKPSLKKHIQEKGQKQLDYARKYGIMALEAKYWDRFQKYEKGEIGNKEDKSRTDVGGKDSPSALSPSGQILAYLKLLKNEDPPRNFFGIVTDGRTWRLHHVDFPEDSFYEFDLGGLLFQLKSRGDIADAFQQDPKLYSWYVEAAKFFYYFFSKDVLFKDAEPTFIDDVLRHREQYVDRAEDDLRERFIDAMKFACNGIKRSADKERLKLDLNETRNLAESHLFNLLFIKNCEARGVLPLYTNYKERSLTYVVERLRQFDPKLSDEDNEDPILKRAFGPSYKNSGTDIYDQVLGLTKMIEEGIDEKSDYDVAGFKQSVFSTKEKSLRQRVKLNNIEMVRVLFALGYLYDDGNWKQIPYNIFTTRQLGSIYESLLEFELQSADEDLEFVNRQWKPIGKSTFDKLKENQAVKQPIALKGELFFTPNNEKRKMSGSYYTPDDVVQYILAETLEPLLKGKSSDQLKEMRVCDPAAGSGHFLSAALKLMTKYFLEAIHEEKASTNLTAPEATRLILDKCIFGVDINPRAIKLAKISLWLPSAQASAPLENLDDQIICGDSLIDEQRGYSLNLSWKNTIFSKKNFTGFDAVIGNPPYFNLQTSPFYKEALRTKPEYEPVLNIQGDIHYYFIFKAFSLLKKNGRCGFIVSRYWLENSHASALREWMRTSARIIEVVDFDKKLVFKDANIHTSIVVFEKSSFEGNVISWKKGEVDSAVVEREQSSLTSGKWVSNESLEWFSNRNIEFAQLKDFFHVYKGIESGCNEAFVVSKDVIEEHSIPKSLCYPVIRNSEIQKGQIKRAGAAKYLIYMSEDKMPDSASLKKWLNENSGPLKSRPEVLAGKYPWYRLRRSRTEYRITDKDKIFAPYRAKTNHFVYDKSGHLGLSDVTILEPKKGMPHKYLRALSSLLNSGKYSEYFERSGKKKGDIIEFLPEELEPLSIPNPNSESKLYDLILEAISGKGPDWVPEVDSIVERYKKKKT